MKQVWGSFHIDYPCPVSTEVFHNSEAYPCYGREIIARGVLNQLLLQWKCFIFLVGPGTRVRLNLNNNYKVNGRVGSVELGHQISL